MNQPMNQPMNQAFGGQPPNNVHLNPSSENSIRLYENIYEGQP
ncbi:16781_t:CDS:1, partial [Racocetra persica]